MSVSSVFFVAADPMIEANTRNFQRRLPLPGAKAYRSKAY